MVKNVDEVGQTITWTPDFNDSLYLFQKEKVKIIQLSKEFSYTFEQGCVFICLYTLICDRYGYSW